jgi:hypothetical protein
MAKYTSIKGNNLEINSNPLTGTYYSYANGKVPFSKENLKGKPEVSQLGQDLYFTIPTKNVWILSNITTEDINAGASFGDDRDDRYNVCSISSYSNVPSGFRATNRNFSWNGSSWSTHPATYPSSQWRLATGGASDDAIAVGGTGTYGSDLIPGSTASNSFNGSAWTAEPSIPVAGSHHSITADGGASKAKIFLNMNSIPTSTSSAMVNWDGTSYSSTPSPVTLNTAERHAEAQILGDDDDARFFSQRINNVLHGEVYDWNGTSWSSSPKPALLSFQSGGSHPSGDSISTAETNRGYNSVLGFALGNPDKHIFVGLSKEYGSTELYNGTSWSHVSGGIGSFSTVTPNVNMANMSGDMTQALGYTPAAKQYWAPWSTHNDTAHDARMNICNQSSNIIGGVSSSANYSNNTLISPWSTLNYTYEFVNDYVEIPYKLGKSTT